MNQGAIRLGWYEYTRAWKHVEGEVIDEALMTIYVNGRDVAKIMSTPREWDWLALGFLKNEGLIEGIEGIDHVYVNDRGCCVDVWLTHAIEKSTREIFTSGCGGGLTFDDQSINMEPLEFDGLLLPKDLIEMFNKLHTPGSLHDRARGVHTAGLTDGEKVLAVTEDIGRHNAVDKLQGACMQKGIETRGRFLIVTGRISSEMLHKGARMGCPIIASRRSPTSLSIKMAVSYNITLVGYVRQRSMRVYTHPERLGCQAQSELPIAGDETIVEDNRPQNL